MNTESTLPTLSHASSETSALAALAQLALTQLSDAHQRTCGLISDMPLLCRNTRHRLVDEAVALTCAISGHCDDLIAALKPQDCAPTSELRVAPAAVSSQATDLEDQMLEELRLQSARSSSLIEQCGALVRLLGELQSKPAPGASDQEPSPSASESCAESPPETPS